MPTKTTTRRRIPADLPAGRASCASCGREHRSLTEDQCRDRKMPERDLQKRVIYRAKRRGWVVAHVGRGFVGGEGGQFVTQMTPGWPDLVLFNPNARGPRVVAMELKREQGVVADLQWQWLDLFNRCGVPAVIIRPSDLREGRVDAILESR